MNREEILNIPAGREMDALVAKEIFGINTAGHLDSCYVEWVTKDGKDGGSGFECPACGCSEEEYKKQPCCKRYSTDISAAWEVVEQVTKKSKFTVIEIRGGNELYQVAFWYPLKDSWHAEGLLPLAICRAALLTVCE